MDTDNRRNISTVVAWFFMFAPPAIGLLMVSPKLLMATLVLMAANGLTEFADNRI